MKYLRAHNMGSLLIVLCLLINLIPFVSNADEYENLALGKTHTFAFSTELTGNLQESALSGSLTDGQYTEISETRYTVSRYQQGQIVVDMGENTPLYDNIQIYDARMGAFETYEVYVSDSNADDAEWTKVAAGNAEWLRTSPTAASATTSILFAAQDKRYVKLYFHTCGTWKNKDATDPSKGAEQAGSICEISIYNVPYTPPEEYESNFVRMSGNLILKKDVYTQSNNEEASKITNGSLNTETSYWMSDNGERQWVLIDCGEDLLFDTVKIVERYNRISDYSIRYTSDDINMDDITSANWQVFDSGTYEAVYDINRNVCLDHTSYKDPIAARYILFEMISNYDASNIQPFVIEEIQLYYTQDGTEINLANKDENDAVTGDTNLPVSETYNFDRMLSPSTEGAGNIQWMTSASIHNENSWGAVDLSAQQKINRVQIVPEMDLIEEYELYYTNDTRLWTQMENIPVNYPITQGIIDSLTPLSSGTLPEYDRFQTDKGVIINETKSSRNYVITLDFEEVEARYLVLVVKKFRKDATPVRFWSFEAYNHDAEKNVNFYTPDGSETVFDTSGYYSGNLCEGAAVSTNAGYVSTVTGTNVAVINNGERFDGNDRFYTTGGMPLYFDFDLGEIKAVDKVIFYEFGAKIKNCSIYVSDNNTDWTKAGTYTNPSLIDNNIPVYRVVDFNPAYGRYIRFSVDECFKTAAISEIEAYCSTAAVAIAEKIDYAMLTDEPVDAITANMLQLPETVTDGSATASIAWSSDREDVINSKTGEVVRQQDDVKVVLTAAVTVEGQTLLKNFTFTVKDNSMEAKERIAELSDNGQGECRFNPVKNFILNDDTVIEFVASGTGNITVECGDIDIKIEIENEKVSAGTALSAESAVRQIPPTENIKFKVEIYDGQADIYIDTSGEYRMLINELPLGEETVFSAISHTSNIALTDTFVSIPAMSVVDLIYNQFGFDKISSDCDFAVSDTLDLFNNIYGADITYTVDTNTVINSETGEILNPGECQIIVGISYNGDTKYKSFDVLADNLLYGSIASSNAVASNGTSADNISDGKLETGYTTKVKNYDVILDIGETKDLSDFIIKEYDNSRITAYELFVSSDGQEYLSVHKGTGIGEDSHISIPPVSVRYVKLSVASAESNESGIYELAGYFLPDNQQKMLADVQMITIPANSKGNFILPAVGTYGSLISYSSDKDYITFTNEGNGSYSIEISEPKNDEYAYITATLVCNGESYTQTYKLLVYGTDSIRDNTPGRHTGTGSSSGNSPGGGFISMDATPVESADEDIEADVQSVPYNDEIAGHWAEEEIRYLMERQVVQGDGVSLNLGLPVTRAEFVAMIVRAMNMESKIYSTSFADVSSEDWYSDIVQTCADYGLINGSDGYFFPNREITREEMAKILGGLYQPTSGFDSVVYTDKDDISDWAKNGVNIATQEGLITGYPDGSFLPKKNLSRDEAMVVIYRLMRSKGV